MMIWTLEAWLMDLAVEVGLEKVFEILLLTLAALLWDAVRALALKALLVVLHLQVRLVQAVWRIGGKVRQLLQRDRGGPVVPLEKKEGVRARGHLFTGSFALSY